MRLPLSLLLFSLLLFTSCATSRHAERHFSKKIQKEVEKSPVFNRAFTGFTLLDPATGKTLADVNGDKYFTPASNTKILTLATCLEVLGDSVPGMQYHISEEDSLVTWYRGVGDPTFLNPYFLNWQRTFNFLKYDRGSGMRMLVPVARFFPTPRFGAGWAWDDYNESFQTERSPLPMYGNLAHFKGDSTGKLSVYPFSFQRFVKGDSTLKNKTILRKEYASEWDYAQNQFYPADFEVAIPFFTNDGPNGLLGDTLKLVRGLLERDTHTFDWHTLYSAPLDTVLRRMMHQSDNFIAEQMLLVCAEQKFDILQQDTIIKWMLDSVLTSLPQRPRWSDGSGLSRYNLISPRDLAQVLLKLWKEQPHEFLLSLFPAGGVSGTIADWYKGTNGRPYVFAKTGGMSGVHCLSGYVVCKSGKTLIFSFMHNNFVGSNRAWKEEMQRVLEMIWERY